MPADPLENTLQHSTDCSPLALPSPGWIQVLELEVENLDIHQLELLEKRILNEMSELGGTRQPQSAYGPVS